MALSTALGIAISLRFAAAEVIAPVKDRMSYWKDADISVPTAIEPAKDRYLIFDYDAGSLNNIRIGWEMAAIAAVMSNRTLVYPGLQTLYCLGAEPSGFEYFLNMPRVHSGLSAISIKEFIQAEQQNYEMPSALLDYASMDGGTVPDEWISFVSEQMTSAGTTTDEVCDLSNYQNDAKVVFTSPYGGDMIGQRIFLCGNYDNVGEPRFTLGQGSDHRWKAPDWVFKLLRNHFIWHPDAFEVAGHVVQELGLFSYVSVHALYGDYQPNYKSPRQTLLSHGGWLGTAPEAETYSLYQVATRLVRKSSGFLAASSRERAVAGLKRGQKAANIIRTWLDKNSSRHVYIATDDTSKEFLKPFAAEGIKVVRWQELLQDGERGQGPLAPMLRKFSRKRIDNLAGCIEQLICTFGRVFLGSKQSKFTGYIERLRLYAKAPTHATYTHHTGIDAPAKGMRLFHDDMVDPKAERRLKAEIRDWELGNGSVVVDRDDAGVLPRNT